MSDDTIILRDEGDLAAAEAALQSRLNSPARFTPRVNREIERLQAAIHRYNWAKEKAPERQEAAFAARIIDRVNASITDIAAGGNIDHPVNWADVHCTAVLIGTEYGDGGDTRRVIFITIEEAAPEAYGFAAAVREHLMARDDLDLSSYELHITTEW